MFKLYTFSDIPHFTPKHGTVKMSRTYECQQCGASFSKLRLLGHPDIFPCIVCGKTFQRTHNLDRHMDKHQDENQHNCDECGKVYSRVDSLQRHHLEVHQLGGGRKRPISDEAKAGSPAKRRITKYDDPEDFYTIRKVRETRIPKVKTNVIQYKVTFNELAVRHLRKTF